MREFVLVDSSAGLMRACACVLQVSNSIPEPGNLSKGKISDFFERTSVSLLLAGAIPVFTRAPFAAGNRAHVRPLVQKMVNFFQEVCKFVVCPPGKPRCFAMRLALLL